MAELFRPHFYVDRATGKRTRAGTPDAVRKKSPTWWIRYYTPDGQRRKAKGYRDKKATETLAAELERRAIRSHAGVIDGNLEEQARRSLGEHLVDYLRDLQCKGRCREHLARTKGRIKVILDGCGFILASDLNAEKVAVFLHDLRQSGPRPALPEDQFWLTPREMITALGGNRPAHLARFLRREGLLVKGSGKNRRYPRPTVEALQVRFCRGIGISTSNGYAAAIKAFSRWLAEKNRTDRDRFISLKLLNADTDPRHERRALSLTELRRLLSAAAQSPFVIHGLDGTDRSMLYATAMVTGFRASELASLFPHSFNLTEQSPFVTVRAAFSKNKKESQQPLPPDVTQALTAYLNGKPMDKAVWPGKWRINAAEMLRRDLVAAGIPYRDNAGRVADFHALRHSYITLLERSGVSPKLAQELARHSDIRLTMNVYTHAGLYDLAAAVNDLPAVLPSECEPNANVGVFKATGTDGKTSQAVSVDRQQNVISLGPCLGPQSAKLGDFVRQAETETRKVRDQIDTGKVSENSTFPANSGQLPGQDSNLDKENQNLLCYRYTTG